MYTFGPIAFLVGIVSTIVTFFIDILTPLTGVGVAPTLAIVLLTVLIRAAMLPLARRQVQAQLVQRRLAPMIAEVRRRFGHDPQKLRDATMRLYKRQNTTPLAGCLPVLVQAPVFFAIYGLFLSREVHGEPNHLLEADLAGVALGDRLPDVAGDPASLALFVGLAIALAVIGWLQVRTMPPPVMQPDSPTAETMLKVTRVLPFLVVAAVPVVPLAAVVYLVTTTAWTVAERVLLFRHLEQRAKAGEVS